MVGRRRDWIIGLAVALLSLAYYLSYANAFLDQASLNDEGLAMYGGIRVMQGQRPLTDFWSYPPGRYWLLAWIMGPFSVNVMTHRVVLAVMLAIKNALAFGVARRVMPRGPALAAALTVALVPGPWHKVYYSLLMFAQLAVLLHYLHRPGAWRAALCGLAAGAAFYFRQDSAAYGLAACAVMITAALLPRGAWKAWLAHGFIVLGAFLVAMLPMAVVYADAWPLTLRRLGPDPVMVAEVVYQRVHFMHPVKLWRYFVANLTHWPNRWFFRGFFPWASAAMMVLGVLSLMPWVTRIKRLRTGQLAWMAVVVWSLFSMMKVYKQPNLEAVLMAGQGSVLIAAGIAWWLWFRWWRSAARRPACLAMWALIGFAWAHLLAMIVVPIAGLESGAWAESRQNGDVAVLKTPRGTFVIGRQQVDTLNRVIGYVQTHTTPDQTIHVWTHPMLYVLCERDNAVATESIVPPVALPDWQAHYREVFTERPPVLQVLHTRTKWLNRLAEYPEDLQRAVFAGYTIVLDTGDYLILRHTGEGQAYDAVMQRLAAPATAKETVKRRDDGDDDEP